MQLTILMYSCRSPHELQFTKDDITSIKCVWSLSALQGRSVLLQICRLIYGTPGSYPSRVISFLNEHCCTCAGHSPSAATNTNDMYAYMHKSNISAVLQLIIIKHEMRILMPCQYVY